MLRGVYNSTVDYAKIDINPGASIDPRTWGPIATGSAVTLENSIRFPSSGYQADFSKAGLASQAWLVHEVAHVYQYQNIPSYSWAKAAAEGLRSDTYQYTLDTSKSFTDYRYEQQATILGDYHAARVTGSPLVPRFETILTPQGLGAGANSATTDMTGFRTPDLLNFNQPQITNQK